MHKATDPEPEAVEQVLGTGKHPLRIAEHPRAGSLPRLELVQEDFQQYYGKNFIQEENLTDPNAIYDVLNEVENYKLYYETEVEAFAKIFFTTKDDFERLQPILESVANRFADEFEEEVQVLFKSSANSFIRLYRFLSQILTFTDVELEKTYVFLNALLKNISDFKGEMEDHDDFALLTLFFN